MTSRSNLWRAWRQLSSRRKRQIGVLFIILTASVAAEAMTLAMVFPLVNSMAQPDLIPSFLLDVLRNFGGQSVEQLRLMLAALFVALVLVSAGVRLFYLWASMKLAFAIGADFTEAAFRKTLALPYAEQTRQNSSNLLTDLLFKMQAIVINGLIPVLSAFGATSLAAAVIFTLFFVAPGVTLALVAITAVLLTVIVLVLGSPLRRIGKQVALIQPQFTERMQVARGGIREIILDGTQDFFAQELSRTQRTLRHFQAQGAFLTTSPRFLMEAVFLIIIMGLAIWTFQTVDDPVAALPSLSIVAFGAMKILPSAQLLVLNWATIRNGSAQVTDALKLLELPDVRRPSATNHRATSFNRTIQLRDVWFRYSDDSPNILSGVDLTIRKGERIGVIGETGAGKSTLIDLIMGLLSPTQGSIEVDGLALSEDDLHAWRKQVAHVPQSIYLTDASVAENIAFGVPKEAVSPSRITEVAHKASIGSFVEDGQAGYATLVGERGARVSGGQRQRIGIARALYKSADLIVLDEATSALDGETEARIMQTILDLGRDKTILMIAHRLTTLKDCDRIIEMEAGRIVRICRYEELGSIAGEVTGA